MLRQFSLLLLAFVLVAASPPETEQLLTESQIDAYQKGVPPSEIVLTTSTPTYELTWLFASGGGWSSGELLSALRPESSPATAFELESTIGQPIAGAGSGGDPGNEYELITGILWDTSTIFSDGFESGDLSAWSSNSTWSSYQ